MKTTDPAERPVVTLLLYYGLLLLIGTVVVRFVPGAGEMISGQRLLELKQSPGLTFEDTATQPWFAWNISLSMALSIVGAFLLMLPTSWVYMATRQLKGFDQQVVQTFIVLAVAVAGVIIIARNSVALAFSLAGVDALTAAAVLSMVFNFIVLIMERGNYGSCALGTDARRLLVGVADADSARLSVESILAAEVSRIRLGKRVEATQLEDALIAGGGPSVIGARIH